MPPPSVYDVSAFIIAVAAAVIRFSALTAAAVAPAVSFTAATGDYDAFAATTDLPSPSLSSSAAAVSIVAAAFASRCLHCATAPPPSATVKQPRHRHPPLFIFKTERSWLRYVPAATSASTVVVIDGFYSVANAAAPSAATATAAFVSVDGSAG